MPGLLKQPMANYPGEANEPNEPANTPESSEPNEPKPANGPGEAGETQEEPGENVGPEEQAAYDEFMNNAFLLVYDDKMFPQILDRIKSSPEPTEALAAVVTSTVMRLQDSAKQAGKPLSTDVMVQGGKELIEDLAETSEKAGVHTFTDDELESAVYQSLDLYREMGSKDGRIDQDAVKQDMGALMEANQMGELGTFFPELKDKFGKGDK